MWEEKEGYAERGMCVSNLQLPQKKKVGGGGSVIYSTKKEQKGSAEAPKRHRLSCFGASAMPGPAERVEPSALLFVGGKDGDSPTHEVGDGSLGPPARPYAETVAGLVSVAA